MKINIWLDDVREIPQPKVWDVEPILFTHWCRTFEEALALVYTKAVTHIDFDHDLGLGRTGYDLAVVIEQGAEDGSIPPMSWNIHSGNPVGARNINRAMLQAEKFWGTNK
jgi:hypothetical protein